MDKRGVLISTELKKHINIGSKQTKNINCEKRLELSINSRLGFEKHITTISGESKAK